MEAILTFWKLDLVSSALLLLFVPSYSGANRLIICLLLVNVEFINFMLRTVHPDARTIKSKIFLELMNHIFNFVASYTLGKFNSSYQSQIVSLSGLNHKEVS